MNFYEARRQHHLEEVLYSISFVGKASFRAIQMADLFAFYSRRRGKKMEMAPIEERERVRQSRGIILNIVIESVPHRALSRPISGRLRRIY